MAYFYILHDMYDILFLTKFWGAFLVGLEWFCCFTNLYRRLMRMRRMHATIRIVDFYCTEKVALILRRSRLILLSHVHVDMPHFACRSLTSIFSTV